MPPRPAPAAAPLCPAPLLVRLLGPPAPPPPPLLVASSEVACCSFAVSIACEEALRCAGNGGGRIGLLCAGRGGVVVLARDESLAGIPPPEEAAFAAAVETAFGAPAAALALPKLSLPVEQPGYSRGPSPRAAAASTAVAASAPRWPLK